MAEQRLLRIGLLSPSHLGSAWGEAALDRPTQVDAWRELPFVPASALKGVMAGRRGNVAEEGEEPNEHRERRYGSPDRAGEPGQASRVVVGDGRPLAFPVRARSGGRCWVFPAETLAWASRLLPGRAEHDVVPLLASLEAARPEEDVLAQGPVPRFVGVSGLGGLRNVPPAEAAGLFGYAVWLTGGLAGGLVPPGDSLLVAGSRRAAALWRTAAERRHLTAIAGERKVVRSGSLRSVELVPEGAVFLSLVSLLDGEEPELGRVQVGAWESQGFGWAELSWVTGSVSSSELAAPGEAGGGENVDLARTMDRALAAVTALQAAGEGVAAVGRTAVRRFGWRFRQQGPEAVLAFELARARVHDPEPTDEMRAHRWLLAALVLDGGDEEAGLALGDGPCRPLVAWLDGRPFAAVMSESEAERVLARLGWLRRYGEVLLEDREEVAAG